MTCNTTHHCGCDCHEARHATELAAERARADSITASITAACEGTGCVNAHELAEALKAARQLIYDHCEDEAMVRVILKEFDHSDSYGSDGPIELAERAAEALRQARADRDRLADALRCAIWVLRLIRDGSKFERAPEGTGVIADLERALSRVNGGGE